MKKIAIFGLLLAASVLPLACNKKPEVSENTAERLPVFSLATSEHPSWSTFMVAGKAGLINPDEGGEPGTLEKKWGVDIVLYVKDYDPCLTMYGNGSVDAVCMTNMDSLNPAIGRPSTTIMPTSTSVGADKVIGVGFDTKGQHVANFLKGKKTYGLSKSVSEYVFVRGLQVMELSPKDFQFVNLEPSAAATALQTGSNDVKNICVWNPYALQTLRTQKSAQTVFDSSLIPEEIIDQVVVANEALKREGGENFACCVCDVFYEVNKRMADPKSADVTLKALGENFSNLPVEDMKICVTETRFYGTPEAGIKLYSSDPFRKTMGTVVTTCQQIGVLDADKAPSIGYGDPNSQLNFETKYMKKVAGQ